MKASDVLEAVYGATPPRVDGAMLAALHLQPPLPSAHRGPAFERLPEPHRRLLAVSDGLDLLAGSYRLFGWANRAARPMARWNDEDTWKFAWEGRASPFFCFGESVLGNQYAYLEDELASAAAPRIFELYAVTFEPLCEYRDFAHFFDAGFVNGVLDDPYHRRIAAKRAELGGFDLDRHLAYMPSPLLTGGQLDVQQLVPLNAAAHMIVSGDLYRSLAHLSSLEGLHGLENYEDEEGRLRVRPVWGSPALH